MAEPNLIAACGIAFLAVFCLLAFLAAAMHLITVVFPEQRATVDAAVAAAIQGVVAVALPGSRVTRIEEER